MRCPECEDSFPFTWVRYMRAPLGRTCCPFCDARLVLKHRWFYWPAMVLGGALVCAAFFALGNSLTGSIVVTMAFTFLGGLLCVLPADKYLETHFSVLMPVGKRKSPAAEVPPVPEESNIQEPEEEQA